MTNLKEYFTKEINKEKQNLENSANRDHFKTILQTLNKSQLSPYRKNFYVISSILSAALLALVIFSPNSSGNNSSEYRLTNSQDKSAVLNAIDQMNSFEEENYEQI